MSCNIKLAVSESSQLSVSLVVPACRAAHLCLLDKTLSTLPTENILSPFLSFFSSSFPSLLFHFLLLSIPLSVLLSFSPFLSAVSVLFSFSHCHFFFFFNSPLPPLPSSSPHCPAQFIFLAFFSAFAFLLFFCFPSLAFPAVRFDFVLFRDLFCQSFEFKAKEAAVFIFSLHLDEHTHERACTIAGWLIETCVSKLLMFTEALYCR